MKISIIVKLSVLCLFVTSLTACGIHTPRESERGPAVTSGNETPITHVAYLDMVNQHAVSPDGLYSVCQVQLGGENLFYVDAESRQETYLCAAPNCTHDSLDCTSYLPMNGEYGYGIFFFDSHLYVLQNTPIQSHGPYLMQIEPDGTNRKTVLELQDGESFLGSVFGYGSSLLMEINVVDETGTWHRRLEQIDLQSGEREILLEYPTQEKQVFTLMGVAGTNLIYLCSNYEQNQYFKVDLSSSDVSLEHWQDNTLGPQFDNVTSYCNVQGDYFCTYDTKTNRLGYENLLTGETREFDAPALAPGETLYGLVYLFDDQFALTLDDAQNNIVLALLDSESGNLTGVRYMQTKENSHTIVGDFGESIICQVSNSEQLLEGQDKEGLINELSYYSIYSIISKDDFLKGIQGTEIAFPG